MIKYKNITNHFKKKNKLYSIATTSTCNICTLTTVMNKVKFHVDGSNIDILATPSEFHAQLRMLIKSSRKRIYFASLYLGTGEKEVELINHLISHYCKSSTAQNQLKVHFHVDYLRASRSESTGNSSLDLLFPISSRDIGKVSLYHTPALHGYLKHLVPARYNETIGLSHFKAIIVDDTLLLTGANLSSSYFTDRQDRYVMFRDCKGLSDFYVDLIETVSTFSYSQSPESPHILLPPAISPIEQPEKFKSFARDSLHEFSQRQLRLSTLTDTSDTLDIGHTDTIVTPLIQASVLGIHQDEQEITSLLREHTGNTTAPSRLTITSGYFNLASEYENIILQSKNRVSIIGAAPEANGFYGAPGPAGYIPHVYSWILIKFMQNIKSIGNENILVWLYNRPAWTYHAKGIWIYKNKQVCPSIMTIGSPNYGQRSIERDLESEVLVETSNKDLEKKMQQEVENLFKFTQGVTEKQIEKPPIWVRYLLPLIKSMF